MAELKEARVPDIGDYDDVPVIEVLVAVGDTVAKDQGLVTLESDKATMEVPAPFAGVVKELKVKLGDTLSEGGVVAMIEAADGAAAKPRAAAPRRAEAGRSPPPKPAPRSSRCAVAAQPDSSPQREIAAGRSPRRRRRAAGARQQARRRSRSRAAARRRCAFDADAVMPDKVPYASPAVRLFARELGVDLLAGQGQRARRPHHARKTCSSSSRPRWPAARAPRSAGGCGGGGLNLLPWPKVDFAKFGEIETKPLSQIKKISGANLARNWAMIPHVTQHDDADITELEALRVALNKENEKAGIKLTMLAFLIKAVVAGAEEISRTSTPRSTPAART